MLSRTALGVPRFSITSVPRSSSSRRKSLPRLLRTRSAETTMLSSLLVLINYSFQLPELYSWFRKRVKRGRGTARQEEQRREQVEHHPVAREHARLNRSVLQALLLCDVPDDPAMAGQHVPGLRRVCTGTARLGHRAKEVHRGVEEEEDKPNLRPTRHGCAEVQQNFAPILSLRLSALCKQHGEKQGKDGDVEYEDGRVNRRGKFGTQKRGEMDGGADDKSYDRGHADDALGAVLPRRAQFVLEPHRVSPSGCRLR